MTDPLVRGKVRNLTRVVEHLDGLLLGPGEVFSFWTAVGPPVRRRGFVPGPVLGSGRLGAGDGGGICAAANLLRWLALHAELDVVECSEHSVDPFPDDGRTVPWGTGATVSWPRQDLRIVVRDQLTYQWRLDLADGFLRGRLLAERTPRYAYVVHERDAGFLLVDGVPWRRNEIWRTTHEVRTGRLCGDALLLRNQARTAYPPPVLGPVAALPAEPLAFPSPRQ
jgi:vancomycin resistance protein VanW